jgi:hypothetical protein
LWNRSPISAETLVIHIGFELHRWLAYTSIINSSDDGIVTQHLKMPETLPLLHGNVTLESALEK